LTLTNVLTFGKEQTIDFAPVLNVVCGPNGSGKSRLLDLLEMDCFGVDPNEVDAERQRLPPAAAAGGALLHRITLDSSFKNSFIKTGTSQLTLAYFDFQEQLGALVVDQGQLTKGNPTPIARSVQRVNSSEDIAHLHRGLHRLRAVNPESDERPARRVLKLWFALEHIFGVPIEIDPDGTLWERKWCRSDQAKQASPDNLHMASAGMLRTASLLANLIFASSPVILIDEPELNLEPGAARRLVDVILWLASAGFCNSSRTHRDNFLPFERVWIDWLGKRGHNQSALADSVLPRSFDQQLIVATHAPALIDMCFRLGSDAALIELTIEEQVTSHSSLSTQEIAQGRLRATKSRNIETREQAVALMDDLGVRGSDLLQANGVIWVEGPSDIVFIEGWLDLWSKEHGAQPWRRGTHYEFNMFGGAILANIGLVQADPTSLVTIMNISRKAFIVIDSDLHPDHEGKLKDSSKFGDAKQRIRNQVKQLRSDSELSNLWLPEENPSTIEGYCRKEDRSATGSGNKKSQAINVVRAWKQNPPKLAEFPHDLATEIDNLARCIEDWNV